MPRTYESKGVERSKKIFLQCLDKHTKDVCLQMAGKSEETLRKWRRDGAFKAEMDKKPGIVAQQTLDSHRKNEKEATIVIAAYNKDFQLYNYWENIHRAAVETGVIRSKIQYGITHKLVRGGYYWAEIKDRTPPPTYQDAVGDVFIDKEAEKHKSVDEKDMDIDDMIADATKKQLVVLDKAMNVASSDPTPANLTIGVEASKQLMRVAKERKEVVRSKTKYSAMSLNELRNKLNKISLNTGTSKMEQLFSNVTSLDAKGLTKLREEVMAILNTESNVMLSREREIIEAYLDKIDSKRYVSFVPTGKQEEFGRAMQHAKMSVFLAANGVGKTTQVINMIVNVVWDNVNPYFRYPVYDNWGEEIDGEWVRFNRIGLLIFSGSKLARESLFEEIDRWFPKGEYTSKDTAGLGFDNEFVLRPGTEHEFKFFIMTHNQDVQKVESANASLICIEEIPKKKVLAACVARTRKGGKIIISATATKDKGDELIEYIGSMQGGIELYRNQEPKTTAVYLLGSMEDSCRKHGVRGHLHCKHIQEIEALLPEEEMGRVTPLDPIKNNRKLSLGFNRNVHVVDEFLVDDRYTVYCALDPHNTKDDYVLWLAVNGAGQKYIIAEHTFITKVPQKIVDTILRAEVKFGWNVASDRVIDWTATSTALTAARKNDRGHRGLTEATLEDEFNSVSPSVKFHSVSGRGIVASREARDRMIMSALHYRIADSGAMDMSPSLFIFSSCKRAIREFSQYERKENKNTGRTVKQKLDDESVECVGRLLAIRPTHTQVYEEAQSRAIIRTR